MERLTIKEVRELLNIDARNTLKDYLKALGLFGLPRLNWVQIRQCLELQIYLGLKHGIHSKEKFLKLSQDEIDSLFQLYGVDIDSRIKSLKMRHRDSVQNNLARA